MGIEASEPAEDSGRAQGERGTQIRSMIGGRRVRLVDLLDGGLIEPGQEVVWDRPRLGQTYRAVITENGSVRLEDGRTFSSLSTAATQAASVAAVDGWYAWRADGVLMKDLRVKLIELAEQDDST